MTKKRKLIASLAAVAVLAAATVGGTLAYFTDSDTRSNVITIGQVNGTLTETEEQTRPDGTTGKDYANVKPGDVLAKDPTVTLSNNSEDAYVRVSISNEGLTEAQFKSIEAGLDIQEGWTKSSDGYYYYNKILSNKIGAVKTSKVFTKVTIPTTWSNAEAGITFNINLKAEFIQADNFIPVKDSTGNITGWGQVDIEPNNLNDIVD